MQFGERVNILCSLHASFVILVHMCFWFGGGGLVRSFYGGGGCDCGLVV